MLTRFAGREANFFLVPNTRKKQKNVFFFSVQHIRRRASVLSNGCYHSWGGRGPFATRGGRYQHYLFPVPLHYRSEWGRGFVTVLQCGNDVLCHLRRCQLPAPTGQKLGSSLQGPPHHTHAQGLSVRQQGSTCPSLNQQLDKNLCAVMISTQLTPLREKTPFPQRRASSTTPLPPSE